MSPRDDNTQITRKQDAQIWIYRTIDVKIRRNSHISTEEMPNTMSCIDYRRLNAMIVDDSYPIPRMEKFIDYLVTTCVFFTLDCKIGYWQIDIHEKDRHKTGFLTHQGLFHFIKMPLGLSNTPVTFQRAIEIMLPTFKCNFSMVYVL